MYKILENGQVLKQEKTETYEQWLPIGMAEKLTITNQSTTVNTTINIPIHYEKFVTYAYITDTVNKSVEVYLNGTLQGTTEIVNGIGNVEFVSAEAGTYTLIVENTSCEVIVV